MGKTSDKKPPQIGARLRLDDPDDRALYEWFLQFVKKPWVKAVAGSKVKVFKSALRYLKRLDEADRQSDVEAILADGAASNGAPLLDEVLEQLSWGEHAFHGKRYSWALLEFQRLDAHTTSRRMPSLERFAQFRQAHCWMDLAGLLRRKALRARSAGDAVTEHFQAAMDCLSEAAWLGNRLILATTHRIVRYNLACTYCLLAQFTVEAALIDDPRLATVKEAARMRNAGDLSDEDLDAKFESLWAELGRVWRVDVNHAARDKAAALAREAMKWLLATSTEGAMPTLGGFIYEFAESDPDLLLLRHDNELQSEFEGWLNLGQRESDAKLLGAAKDLLKGAGLRHPPHEPPRLTEAKPEMGRGAIPPGMAPPQGL